MTAVSDLARRKGMTNLYPFDPQKSDQRGIRPVCHADEALSEAQSGRGK